MKRSKNNYKFEDSLIINDATTTSETAETSDDNLIRFHAYSKRDNPI